VGLGPLPAPQVHNSRISRIEMISGSQDEPINSIA
jgi:hypothetical protein